MLMQSPSASPTLSRIGAVDGGDDPIASPFRRAGLAPFSFVSTIGAVRETVNPLAGHRSMIGVESPVLPTPRSGIGGVVTNAMWEHRPADAPAMIGMQRMGPCGCGGDCAGANAGCGCGGTKNTCVSCDEPRAESGAPITLGAHLNVGDRMGEVSFSLLGSGLGRSAPAEATTSAPTPMLELWSLPYVAMGASTRLGLAWRRPVDATAPNPKSDRQLTFHNLGTASFRSPDSRAGASTGAMSDRNAPGAFDCALKTDESHNCGIACIQLNCEDVNRTTESASSYCETLLAQYVPDDTDLLAWLSYLDCMVGCKNAFQMCRYFGSGSGNVEPEVEPPGPIE